MIMNPNILNQNPLMFFDRAVNAQRSQLLTVMADAVSECRTAADQAAELNETGQVGLLRLAEVWSTSRAKEGMGGLFLEGTEAKILSDVVAPVSYTHLDVYKRQRQISLSGTLKRKEVSTLAYVPVPKDLYLIHI